MVAKVLVLSFFVWGVTPRDTQEIRLTLHSGISARVTMRDIGDRTSVGKATALPTMCYLQKLYFEVTKRGLVIQTSFPLCLHFIPTVLTLGVTVLLTGK